MLIVGSVSVRAGQPADLVAAGRHLVENVGMCQDCHSPRNPDGSFDRARWLMGSPLGFKPLMEMPWAPAAPGIAGFPGYTDAQAIEFLMTGKRPSGIPVRPPMPEYRLKREEAAAVVAYLRSLSPAATPTPAAPEQAANR